MWILNHTSRMYLKCIRIVNILGVALPYCLASLGVRLTILMKFFLSDMKPAPLPAPGCFWTNKKLRVYECIYDVFMMYLWCFYICEYVFIYLWIYLWLVIYLQMCECVNSFICMKEYIRILIYICIYMTLRMMCLQNKRTFIRFTTSMPSWLRISPTIPSASVLDPFVKSNEHIYDCMHESMYRCTNI